MSIDTPESEVPRSWVKPQRKRTLPELRELIVAKRAELQALEREAAAIENESRLQAIAQARNIMRANGLTLSDVVSAKAPAPFSA